MKKMSDGMLVAFCGAALAGMVGIIIDSNDKFWEKHIKLFNHNVNVANHNERVLSERVEELEKTVAELTNKGEN